MEREVVFVSLVGSHNYNLNHEKSDRDYKAFVVPTFEDLYKGNMYSKQTIGEDEDIDVHDIRKLPNLLYKSNLNFMEVLFSDDIMMDDCGELNNIYSHRHEISRINLPSFYNACMGISKGKMSMLGKGTEGTQHLVDQFGYDTKQAVHAFRNVKILVDFCESGFHGLGDVIKYQGEDREFFMKILRGELTREEFEKIYYRYIDSHVSGVRNEYKVHVVNDSLKEFLDNNIMSLVKRKLT